MSLVSNGLALAYVPDFVAQSSGLKVVDAMAFDHMCEEHIELIYKPSLASGWLNRLAHAIQQP